MPPRYVSASVPGQHPGVSMVPHSRYRVRPPALSGAADPRAAHQCHQNHHGVPLRVARKYSGADHV